ncbi:Tn3 family transposase [Elizabethkingia anophelis]|nr:Tn3 family transposase [Elizabethkingia anophelis]
MAKFIFYGNKGKLSTSSKEEYLQAISMKALIHNLIICWNYMYPRKNLWLQKQKIR